jgi:hypothetical protein
MDEEEGFMEVVESEKKVEAKRVSPKYPPGTVSGTIIFISLHPLGCPKVLLLSDRFILFRLLMGCT